jgi:citrate lyase subunit beta/citryl-CoA lyase
MNSWRSMLFIPANSWRMIMRATTEMQDAVILDLEDAVPVAEKETARVFARDSVPILKSKGIDVFVRVNSLGTGLTEEDLRFVVVKGLHGIMLPKSETKQAIVKLDRLLGKEEMNKKLKPNSISIMPLLESPRGVLNASEIATASKRVDALGFGAGDFLRELGEGFAIARLSPDEYFPMILYARSRISIAARVAGVPAIDTPFFGLLIDTEGLIRESSRAKLLGFKGKMLIHPRHVEPVNQLFSPSKEEIEFSSQMINAYKEAEARGSGAASFGGRMIDYAMVSMGQDLLSRAEAIAEKEKRRVEEKY